MHRGIAGEKSLSIFAPAFKDNGVKTREQEGNVL